MDPAQLVLQLGIAGALIYFGSAVANTLIKNWRAAESERITSNRASEAERTTAIAAGFSGMASAVSALTSSINTHAAADLQSHTNMASEIAEMRGQITEALAWQDRTPTASPPPIPQAQPVLKLPQQHPAINEPRTSTRRNTPPAGSPTEYSVHPRGKTNG
jgi:hypothetical protein